MEKTDLKVDQSMIVWRGTGTRHRYDARVAKVSRKYVTIEYWVSPGITREIEFNIETQKERGPNAASHYAAVFRTKEQQEMEDRERAVRDRLRFYGLLPKYTGPTTRRTLTLFQMEQVVKLLDDIVEDTDGD
jgi:hypothetical protein